MSRKDFTCRKDLVAYVAKKTRTSAAAAAPLVDAVLQGIVELATASRGLTIHEFGRFEIRERKQRLNTSSISGKPSLIPARTSLAFVASPALVQIAEEDEEVQAAAEIAAREILEGMKPGSARLEE